MIHLSNKAKHYALIALKVLILTASLIFIYSRLASSGISYTNMMSQLSVASVMRWLPVFILLALLNWIFEIIKWKTLVSALRPISFKEATVQCLMSHGASVPTPGKVAEYGVKPLFFKPSRRKKIMVLKLYSNLSQLFATIFFGIPALVWVSINHNLTVKGWNILLLSGGLLLLSLAGYILRKKELLVKGLSLSKIVSFIRTLGFFRRFTVVLYALLRYLLFSTLFFFVLRFFGAEISFYLAFPYIAGMYLLASAIPVFFIFDLAVKGGIALWLFSFTAVGEYAVISTVFVMWLLNFAIPALFGSYFVLKFKPVAV